MNKGVIKLVYYYYCCNNNIAIIILGINNNNVIIIMMIIIMKRLNIEHYLDLMIVWIRIPEVRNFWYCTLKILDMKL